MFLRILLLLTIVPAVELFLLLQIGSWLGPTSTFLLILITGIVGAALAKREGLGVLTRLQEEMRQGMPPGSRLVEGVLVLVGGLLLITPGVFTDLVGFLLIAPPTRRLAAARAVDALSARFEFHATGLDGAGLGGVPPTPGERHRPAEPHRPFANPFDDLP